MTRTPSRHRNGSAMLASLVASGALVVCAIATTAYISTAGIHLSKQEIMPASGEMVSTLPREFKTWKSVGVDAQSSKEEIDALGTENFLTRQYVASAESPVIREIMGEDREAPVGVSMHLAYYTGMVDTVPHVPERCFVSAGIQEAGEGKNVDIPIDMSKLIPDLTIPDDVLASMVPEGDPIWMARSSGFQRVRLPANLKELAMRVTPFYDGRNDVTLHAGYFFIANGEVVPNANQVRLKAFDLKDDYAFYMKVQFTSADAETPEQLAAIAGSMLDEMFADIMARTPDWVEVRMGVYPPGNSNTPQAPSGEE